jgi:flagellar motor switch protein FliM
MEDVLSKDHIREIALIHEKFANMASKSLSEQLRSKITMKIGAVDQFCMGDFFRSIPSSTIFGIINMEPLNGIAIIGIDFYTISAIIDKVCG